MTTAYNPSPRARRPNIARLVVGAGIVALSVLSVHKAFRLFSFDPAVLGKYFTFKWIIMGHVAGGLLALFTGPLQLWKAFRVKYWQVHRVLGRVYVASVGVGAVCALILASTTALSVGWAYALSLHMLASVWLVCALLAWRTAVKKKFKQHEDWATRAYIVTVAFVAQSVTFDLPFVARLGSLADVSPTLIWFSWSLPMFAYDVVRISKQK